MEKIKKTGTTTPSAIELDRSQLEELDKLIGNLKKEIIFPGQKKRHAVRGSPAGWIMISPDTKRRCAN